MTKERIEELRDHLRLDDDIEPNIGAALSECLDEIERLQAKLHGYDSIVASMVEVIHEKSPLLKHFEDYEGEK